MFSHEANRGECISQGGDIEKVKEDQGRIETERQGLFFIKWPQKWLNSHTEQEGLRRYMLEGWISCQNWK